MTRDPHRRAGPPGRAHRRHDPLLPARGPAPPGRAGRPGQVYGADHLDRLDQIRDLQARRFSLAAIRALVESDRPGLVDGLFAGEGGALYSLDELVERSGDVRRRSSTGSRDAGLLPDPAEFGRDAYDDTDLDLLRAVAELARLGMPDDVLVELGVDLRRAASRRCSARCSTCSPASADAAWDAEELAAVQHRPRRDRPARCPPSTASSTTCTSARCSASRSTRSSASAHALTGASAVGRLEVPDARRRCRR